MYYSVIRRGGTTSTLWTPSELSSTQAWYDVSAETGYADGDTITSLTDQSGNGITVSGTGIYNTGVQNGLPVATQSGDFVSASVSDFDGHTRAILMAVVNNPSGGALSILNSDDTSSVFLQRLASDVYRVFLSISGFNATAGAPPVPAGMHLSAAVINDYSGGNAFMRPAVRVNGTETRNNASSAHIEFLATGHVVKMYNSTAGQQLCEAVLVSDDVSYEWTNNEPEKIEGYLAHKWGLTANLPAAHPYKSLAPTV